jgi:hypothetical protein
MREFKFEPLKVNSTAPGGACVFRTFDDIGTFILNKVDLQRRQTGYWQIVRQDLMQARFGARRAEVHAAMREALLAKEWLAS